MDANDSPTTTDDIPLPNGKPCQHPGCASEAVEFCTDCLDEVCADHYDPDGDDLADILCHQCRDFPGEAQA